MQHLDVNIRHKNITVYQATISAGRRAPPSAQDREDMDTFYAAAAPYVHGFYIAYAQSARAGRRGRRPRPLGHRRAETGTRGHRAEPRRAVGPPGARTRGRDVGCSRILEPGREIARDT